jgi:hypothetical protein
MDKNSMNISSVETYLNSIFDNTISNNTIFGYMLEKAAIPNEWSDMVMIEIPNGIEDLDAYGNGTILVWLYARPLMSGKKNVSVMAQLEKRLNEVLKNQGNDTYQLTRRLTYTSYDTDIDWHCNVVELTILIV